MNPPALADRLAAEWAGIDGAFRRAADGLGSAVPCRRGCSACCAPVFDIHPADALVLGRWWDEQPESLRRPILERARTVVTDVARTAGASGALGGGDDLAAWTPADGFGALGTDAITAIAAASTGACPLLGDEGECLAYSHRPAICRLQGLPWRDTTRGVVLPDLCRLVPGQAGIPPQGIDLMPLDAGRFEVRDQLGDWLGRRLPPSRTFVAEALVRWAEGT